jgi:hypothetical protein
MPTMLMTSSWLFPPRTREVQFDEKWAFVGKKQKNCDPNDPDDDQCGDYWDFVAFDPLCGAPHNEEGCIGSAQTELPRPHLLSRALPNTTC